MCYQESLIDLEATINGTAVISIVKSEFRDSISPRVHENLAQGSNPQLLDKLATDLLKMSAVLI
jgi:hypothetical protein